MSEVKKKEHEKKKSYGLLIVGAALLIAGIIFAVYAYNTSYQESVAAGKLLSEAKASASAVKHCLEYAYAATQQARSSISAIS